MLFIVIIIQNIIFRSIRSFINQNRDPYRKLLLGKYDSLSLFVLLLFLFHNYQFTLVVCSADFLIIYHCIDDAY